MAGDPFTSAVFRWLTRVNTDAELPAGAMKLAFAISQYINRESRTAWPSHETLVSAAGFREGENATRNVRRLTKALVDRGHLLTTRRRQTSLVYRLAQDRTELSYQEVIPGAEDKSRPDNSDRSDDQDRTISTVRPDNICHQDRTEMSAKLPSEPLKNHEGEKRTRATFLPNDFQAPDNLYGWALAKLGSNDAVKRSIDRFCDHFRQVDGSKAKCRDWPARLRIWIDDDASRDGRKDRSVHAAAGRLADRLASFDRSPNIEVLTDEQWNAVLGAYVKFGRWTRHVEYGPSPDSAGCFAPPHLLAKHGINKEAAA